MNLKIFFLAATLLSHTSVTLAHTERGHAGPCIYDSHCLIQLYNLNDSLNGAISAWDRLNITESINVISDSHPPKKTKTTFFGSKLSIQKKSDFGDYYGYIKNQNIANFELINDQPESVSFEVIIPENNDIKLDIESGKEFPLKGTNINSLKIHRGGNLIINSGKTIYINTLKAEKDSKLTITDDPLAEKIDPYTRIIVYGDISDLPIIVNTSKKSLPVFIISGNNKIKINSLGGLLIAPNSSISIGDTADDIISGQIYSKALDIEKKIILKHIEFPLAEIFDLKSDLKPDNESSQYTLPSTIENVVFSNIETGALIRSYFHHRIGYGEEAVRLYEKSLNELKSNPEKVANELYSAYMQLTPEPRNQRLRWELCHTLGQLESDAALNILNEIARQPTYDTKENSPAIKSRFLEYEQRIKAQAVDGIGKIAHKGNSEAIKNLQQIESESSGLTKFYASNILSNITLKTN